MSTGHSKLHVLLLLVLLICSVHTSASSHTTAPCFPADATALLQLKRSFLDTNLTSWRAGTDCCRWDAVSCDAVSGRVISLDLGGRDLRSRGLDPALFNLTSLRNLSLAGNDFMRASLPSFGFELLTEMVHLNFSDTCFCGPIPIGIARLRKLVTLDFSSYEYTTELLFLEVPSFQTIIANLSSLRELHLNGVDISSSGETWSIALANSTPELQILTLLDCGLSGSIHHSFSRLRSLVEIDLRGNAVAGKVPDFFADFPLLSSLRLSHNDFEGQFPTKIFHLKCLRILTVSWNPKLSGHLPSFPVENKLEVLVLHGTNFSDALPVSIVNLKSLSNLALTTEGISKQLTLIGKLQSLRELSLLATSLGVEKPHFSWIGDLKHLTRLGIVGYNFSEPIPSWIGNLTNLMFLELISCNFYGTIPPWIGNLTQLSFIDFGGNYLTGKIPRYLFTLPEVQSLFLTSNQLSGHLEDIENPLSSSLSDICLSDNQIGGSIPQSYFQLPSLEVLDLSSNKLTGTVKLSSFWRLSKLFDLRLSNNMLSLIDEGGKLPRSLSNCRGLGLLDVSNNQIADSFPSWLGILPKLRVLVLRSNRFVGVIMDLQENDRIMKHFSSLQILDLASNNFSGNLPQGWFNELESMIENDNNEGQVIGHQINPSEEFYQDTVTITFKGFDLIFTKILTTFKVIDFSKNSFDGPIPESIGRLVSLHGLNMSYNNFTGQIPSQLGNLTRLESMDLSWNHLSGEIPQELTSLTSLAWLNLSYNNFTGRIPQGNQFLTFPNSSFEGNAGLCGSQISKQCDNPGSTTPRASDHPESNSLWQDKLDAILLFTFVGLGFGVGFALAIMFQHLCRIDGWTCKRC
ncbi:receptor-like protein 6 isoform X2 [Phragmites australis]|uniref:receptor-like protein 6 isoform X2 n=1 Tax=Phragmites australis TaxID=29695 RepID=UPI002D770AF0|nr:receptor-like protein 6 isoform X2 [Phragmites australis]